ncbi:MAG: FtsX-like permease family protein, partial [Anaerolineaceae bacterium]|nr:FtsX-like permease family protein [Anaerolineaceae bacterium]
RVGFIDKIDIVLSEEYQISEVNRDLPGDLILVSKNDQKDQVENMVKAFQLNLTALSLLALVVGLFLIYNTMTFSVIQRRELIGVYRGFGFYRSDIFKIILFEALLIAIIGTILGIFGGILLGRQTVNLILQTINDLYYTTIIQDVQIPPISLIKGLLLGIFATILVAIPPAIESTRVTPRNAELRSGLESKTRLSIKRMIFLMAGCFLIGSILLFSPIFQSNLWWAFLATFFVVVGFSLLTAVSLSYLLPILAKPVMKIFGLFPGMAVRELYRSLSRTGIAISSLMVAVSVTMGMTIMIASFRNTVEIWLSETLVGDIYLSVPNQFTNLSTAEIDPDVLKELLNYPDIQSYNMLATVNQFSEKGNVQMDIITNEKIGYERLFLKTSLKPDEIWNSLLSGSILLSEPLSNRLGLDLGDSLKLISPSGPVELPVVGIFFDYASNQGHLIMAKDAYLKNWDSYPISAVSLHLKPDKDIANIVNELQMINIGQPQKIIIRDNKTLQNDALAVFDRTFMITNALRFIATLIAIIGIYGAVLLILEDRKKEIGILKAIGVRSGEFWKLLLTE